MSREIPITRRRARWNIRHGILLVWFSSICKTQEILRNKAVNIMEEYDWRSVHNSRTAWQHTVDKIDFTRHYVSPAWVIKLSFLSRHGESIFGRINLIWNFNQCVWDVRRYNWHICNSERHFKFYYWILLLNFGEYRHYVGRTDLSTLVRHKIHLSIFSFFYPPFSPSLSFYLSRWLSWDISLSLKPSSLASLSGAMNHPNPLDRRILIVDTYLTAKPFY